MPSIKGQPREQVTKLAEEHTLVACDSEVAGLGERRNHSGTLCATMNLHGASPQCGKGCVEALWEIEASGRYD